MGIRLVYYLNVFFFIYMFIYILINFLTSMFAAFELDDFYIRKEYMDRSILRNPANYTPISILVPAYNEEVTIIDSIDSLLELDYPEYEIVIVNDGSKDKTLEKIIKHYNLKKVNRDCNMLVKSKDPVGLYENNKGVKIILADKLNGGKADALNLGINLSNHPLFVCVDADSVLQKDALKRVVEPFLEKDRTVAVGGNIRVSNGRSLKSGFIELSKIPTKPIVMFQIIEYIRVFLNSRISLNRMNGNLIISGAFGIYKKEAAVKVGGYSNGLMGEDMEIVVKIHSYYKKNKIPYRTSYVPDAICWTQVPEDLKTLRGQRKRWHIGLEESLSRHKYMFFNPSYGIIGMLSYPYFVFFEYLTPLIELLGIVTIIASFILDIINIEFLITYLLVYIGYNIVASIVFIIAHTYIFDRDIDRRILYRVLVYSFLESFGYRQVMSLSRIRGMFNRNKNKEWGEMKRVESE